MTIRPVGTTVLATASAEFEHHLVTGGAGFIGSHLCERLIGDGHRVTVIDSFDDFYSAVTKRANLRAILAHPRFRLVERDIRDTAGVAAQLRGRRVDSIIHLAARAGVRPSIDNPVLYSDVNVTGTASMLEVARRLGITRFVFGSSSSVYGVRATAPFRETDAVDSPISPYAATKRAGELLCATYAHLYSMGVVSLRFFTVYGPRQRPDLAIHKFARLIVDGRPIPLFGDGSMRRDFTYVSDIVDGIVRAVRYTARTSGAETLNLGASSPVTVMEMIEHLSQALDRKPLLERCELQRGDVPQTYADVSKARLILGYDPAVTFREGIRQFVAWLEAERPVTFDGPEVCQ